MTTAPTSRTSTGTGKTSSKPRRTRRGKGKQKTLTQACAGLLKELESDLRASIEDQPELKASLEAEWKQARDGGRTGHGFARFRDELVTQVGASWILSAVFVRFVEDNGLIDAPLISGPTHEDPALDRRRMAFEAEQAYYRQHPDHAEREYLLHVFETLSTTPGLDELLDRRHALLYRIMPTIEGGRRLLSFFRDRDDAGEKIRWDFTSADLDTRFLGDLYQDLSESARKSYALLQTPDFVESFILDRTLEPALETFAAEFRDGTFRMIDPTCGSGHFLLGGFQRLMERWRREQPGENPRELARRALESIRGVDLNPFAAAICRFRLLVAALAACDVDRLQDAPNFPIHVAVGDSLLHGPRFNDPERGVQLSMDPKDTITHVYQHEDRKEILAVLGRQYHVVVGNPPYITPKDRALNAAYREKFRRSCHGKYALTVPFMERFVELAVPGEKRSPAGYVGLITANSFMKREFGKKLVEDVFPHWDLTHVIDTSGAYVPGHGTPTVILFLRNQRPVAENVRAVLGIRGEPTTPAEPAEGLVWRAILAQLERPGSESEYVSVEDKPRATFHSHPWSLGGGGAGELKATLDDAGNSPLGVNTDSIGITCFTLEDDIFTQPEHVLRRSSLSEHERPLVEGDSIRDWSLGDNDSVVFPYDGSLDLPWLTGDHPVNRFLWPMRSRLWNNKLFGGTKKIDGGLAWYEYGRFTGHKLRTPLSIAFAFVATHNHFVLDRGGKVFNRSAPVIKLPPEATEDDHLALLGVLNSSTACFWGMQVFHNKGGPGGARSKDEKWHDFYEWAGTKLQECPLPLRLPIGRSRRLDNLAQSWSVDTPSSWGARNNWEPTDVTSHRTTWHETRRHMIAQQEELDWEVYHAYALTDEPLVLADPEAVPPIELGQRAFEIVLARKIAAREAKSTWFERHGSKPITEIPGHWPAEYRRLVERRIALIESDRDIRLIEQPEHKRRWNTEPWDSQLRRALDEALLDRIEALDLWRVERPRPVTVARLAETLAADERFVMMLRVRDGQDAPDVDRAVAALVERESVPFLPVLYLTPTGRDKRAEWEETWRLQRVEDPYLDAQDELLRTHFGETPADQRKAREHVALWRTTKKLTKDKAVTPGSKDHDALLRARTEWQRIENDRKQAIGGQDTPPVPPKYRSGDFRQSGYWRLRGKLDVAKERFIAYPGLSPDGDETLLVGWAGWDHARRAAALALLFQDRHAAAWPPERLAPILQALDQLVPWLHQWHPDTPDGNLGQAYETFVEHWCAQTALTLDQVRAWRPV